MRGVCGDHLDPLATHAFPGTKIRSLIPTCKAWRGNLRCQASWNWLPGRKVCLQQIIITFCEPVTTKSQKHVKERW